MLRCNPGGHLGGLRKGATFQGQMSTFHFFYHIGSHLYRHAHLGTVWSVVEANHGNAFSEGQRVEEAQKQVVGSCSKCWRGSHGQVLPETRQPCILTGGRCWKEVPSLSDCQGEKR